MDPQPIFDVRFTGSYSASPKMHSWTRWWKHASDFVQAFPGEIEANKASFGTRWRHLIKHFQVCHCFRSKAPKTRSTKTGGCPPTTHQSGRGRVLTLQLEKPLASQAWIQAFQGWWLDGLVGVQLDSSVCGECSVILEIQSEPFSSERTHKSRIGTDKRSPLTWPSPSVSCGRAEHHDRNDQWTMFQENPGLISAHHLLLNEIFAGPGLSSAQKDDLLFSPKERNSFRERSWWIDKNVRLDAIVLYVTWHFLKTHMSFGEPSVCLLFAAWIRPQQFFQSVKDKHEKIALWILMVPDHQLLCERKALIAQLHQQWQCCINLWQLQTQTRKNSWWRNGKNTPRFKNVTQNASRTWKTSQSARPQTACCSAAAAAAASWTSRRQRRRLRRPRRGRTWRGCWLWTTRRTTPSGSWRAPSLSSPCSQARGNFPVMSTKVFMSLHALVRKLNFVFSHAPSWWQGTDEKTVLSSRRQTPRMSAALCALFCHRNLETLFLVEPKKIGSLYIENWCLLVSRLLQLLSVRNRNCGDQE